MQNMLSVSLPTVLQIRTSTLDAVYQLPIRSQNEWEKWPMWGVVVGIVIININILCFGDTLLWKYRYFIMVLAFWSHF